MTATLGNSQLFSRTVLKNNINVHQTEYFDLTNNANCLNGKSDSKISKYGFVQSIIQFLDHNKIGLRPEPSNIFNSGQLG